MMHTIWNDNEVNWDSAGRQAYSVRPGRSFCAYTVRCGEGSRGENKGKGARIGKYAYNGASGVWRTEESDGLDGDEREGLGR